MKHYLLLATCALALLFVSCEKDKDKEELSKPTMTIVNGSDYEAWVYCDNNLQTWCGSKDNKKIELDCSVNIPVLVVVEFLNSKGTKVRTSTWKSYTFKWDTGYKLTLTNKESTLLKI